MTDLANYGHKRIHIPLSKPYITSDSPTATMNAISASSKNPEKAIKLLEVLNIDKEIFNLLCFGIEGEHYKKAGDNRIEKINDKYKFTTAWMFGNQFNAYLTPEQTDDVWEKKPYR
jgi:putative aldouronate transport system substrate-binding protein